MSRRIRPVVYAESTVTAEEVRRVLPDAVTRKSVARGDLYRDRALGYEVFLVIDGVFMQQQAISPREVIDVLNDGAMIAGASSMGALRAAECGSCGMRGIGSIYRLYRRGVLDSDDEVVVMFSPLDGSPVSLALVNVRFALSHLVRQGLIDQDQGTRLFESARSLFFADRNWTAIFAGAELEQLQMRCTPALKRLDLKKRDAMLALERLARWLDDPKSLELGPTRGIRHLMPSEMTREIEFSVSRLPGGATDWEQLLEWCLAAGMSELLAAEKEKPALQYLHQCFCEGDRGLSERLFEDEDARGGRAAIEMRYRAQCEAMAWANARDLLVGPELLEQAGMNLAIAHGFDTWAALRSAASCPDCAKRLTTQRERSALGLLVRQHWQKLSDQ